MARQYISQPGVFINEDGTSRDFIVGPGIYVDTAGSGASYTLSVTTGTYALSGKAQTLNVGRSLPAAQGTYTLSGKTITGPLARQVSPVAGAYTLTGFPITSPSSAKVVGWTGKKRRISREEFAELVEAAEQERREKLEPTYEEFEKLTTKAGPAKKAIAKVEREIEEARDHELINEENAKLFAGLVASAKHASRAALAIQQSNEILRRIQILREEEDEEEVTILAMALY